MREGPKRSCSSSANGCPALSPASSSSSLPLVLHIGARQGAIGSNSAGKGSAFSFPTMRRRFGLERGEDQG